MEQLVERLNNSANYIKDIIKETPVIGVVLGSGLGDFADSLDDKIEIPYADIPGFKKTTVIGHSGKLVYGKINGVKVAVMQGRNHAYEGHSMDEVVFPIRVLGTLGIESVILTNASGGVNESYKPGQLVLINDQINLTGTNPLLGPNNESLGTRFPDMSYAYNPELREVAKKAASSIGYELVEGVYAGVLGPSYETPAEVRMIRTLGADLVGMSTVSECIAANHMGIKVCGISCVTNMAAGILKEKLSHDDIKEQAETVMKSFCNILTEVIKSHA